MVVIRYVRKSCRLHFLATPYSRQARHGGVAQPAEITTPIAFPRLNAPMFIAKARFGASAADA